MLKHINMQTQYASLD